VLENAVQLFTPSYISINGDCSEEASSIIEPSLAVSEVEPTRTIVPPALKSA
jgi:hypothetical protein